MVGLFNSVVDKPLSLQKGGGNMSSFTDAFHTLGTNFHGAVHAVSSNVQVYVAAFLIVLIGVVLGFVAKWIVVLILRSVKLQQVAANTSWNTVVGTGYDLVDLLGEFVRWFFVIIAVVEALVVLDVPQVNSLVHGLLNYLPNVFAAAFVLGVAGVFAVLASRLVMVVTKFVSESHAALLGTVTRVAIWTVAVLLALAQLQLAQTYINDLFFGVLVAAALAFGLGGRDQAGKWLTSLSDKAKGKH